MDCQRESQAHEVVEPSTLDGERQLVARLLARHPDVWKHFVQQYRVLLASFLQRQWQLARQPLKAHDLDDMLAEVFSLLVQNDYAALRNFEFKSRLSTWLIVIAKRTCWRHLKRQQRFRQPGQGQASEFEVLAELAEPAKCKPYDSEMLQAMRSQMHSLAERDRQLLELFYFEELDYKTIAEKLQLSVNSIGPKLQRAQARLKRRLEAS